MEFDEIFAELVKRSRPSAPLVCYTIPIPNLDSNEVTPISISFQSRANTDWSFFKYLCGIQTESVGTNRSNPGIHLEDDGGLSSDNDDSVEETDFIDASDITPPPSASPKPLLGIYIPPSPTLSTTASSRLPF